MEAPVATKSSRPHAPAHVRILKAVPSLAIRMGLLLVLKLGGQWSAENSALSLRANLDHSDFGTHGDIVTVSIDRDGYGKVFDRTSPLNASIVDTLVRKILDGHPAVVGVDIDSSHHSFRTISPQALPRVVWGRGVEEGDDGQLRLADFLGGSRDRLETTRFGVAVLPDDDEILRYQRQIEIGGRAYDTLPWALVRAFEDATGQPRPAERVDTGAWEIRYSDAPLIPDIPISELMKDGFRWSMSSVGPIAGKIVLLGGRYDRADVHATPYGNMDGFYIVANAIRTELDGRARKSLSWTSIGMAEAAELVVVFLIYVLLNDWWTFGRLLIAQALTLLVAVGLMVFDCFEALPFIMLPFYWMIFEIIRRLQKRLSIWTSRHLPAQKAATGSSGEAATAPESGNDY